MFQILFLLGWMGIFVGSIAGIIYGVAPEVFYVQIAYLKEHQWIIYLISIFYLIISVEKFILIISKSSDKSYTFKLKNGKISISFLTIKKIINAIAEEKNYINECMVKVKRKNEGDLLVLNLVCKETENLSGELMSFQEEIIKRVDSTMAIKVLNIKVELKDIENTSKIKLEAK